MIVFSFEWGFPWTYVSLYELFTDFTLCHRFHPYHQIRLDMSISDLPSDIETNSESNNISCGIYMQ